MGFDELDKKALRYFEGRIVRKDLVRTLRKTGSGRTVQGESKGAWKTQGH